MSRKRFDGELFICDKCSAKEELVSTSRAVYPVLWETLLFKGRSYDLCCDCVLEIRDVLEEDK